MASREIAFNLNVADLPQVKEAFEELLAERDALAARLERAEAERDAMRPVVQAEAFTMAANAIEAAATELGVSASVGVQMSVKSLRVMADEAAEIAAVDTYRAATRAEGEPT